MVTKGQEVRGPVPALPPVTDSWVRVLVPLLCVLQGPSELRNALRSRNRDLLSRHPKGEGGGQPAPIGHIH